MIPTFWAHDCIQSALIDFIHCDCMYPVSALRIDFHHLMHANKPYAFHRRALYYSMKLANFQRRHVRWVVFLVFFSCSASPSSQISSSPLIISQLSVPYGPAKSAVDSTKLLPIISMNYTEKHHHPLRFLFICIVHHHSHVSNLGRLTCIALPTIHDLISNWVSSKVCNSLECILFET